MERAANKKQKQSDSPDPAIDGYTVFPEVHYSDMILQITNEFAKAENNVIKEVLRQIVKREPTLEDAKDLQRFQKEGEVNKYYLAYKNLKLGTVYLNTNIESGKMGVEFVPFEMEDFLEPATNLDGTKVTF
jgi:Na+-translocating ferredoxin:NAD+ oxidoreductase RnfG subunit